MNLLFLPLAFVYYELLLRLFASRGFAENLVYPLVFAVSAGLALSALLSFLPARAERALTGVLLVLNVVPFIAEALIKSSFQTYMEPRSALSGAGSVIERYGESFSSAILGGIPQILLFLVPAVLYCVLARTLVPQSGRKMEIAVAVSSFLFALLLFVIGSFMIYWSNTSAGYHAEYQFDSATEKYGLFTGMRMSLAHIFGGDVPGGGFVSETVASESETEPESGIEETQASQLAEADDDTELTDAAATEADSGEPPLPVEPGDNQMEIDFEEIGRKYPRKAVLDLNEYVQSLPPSGKNAYTGLFAGKNLILICAEAFSDVVISEELTPTLYRLSHNGIYFSDYYQPTWGGSTSTGEFSFLTGLVPRSGLESMQKSQYNNNYFTLGSQLQRLDYTSCAYHNGWYDYYDRHLTHRNLGYDDFLASGNGLEKLMESYAPDAEMIGKTIDEYIGQQPFSLYYMTLSGHCVYKESSPLVREHLPEVREYYKGRYKDKTLYYICYQLELEHALNVLVAKLEEAGIADDTVICLTADHYPYGLEKNETFANAENYVADLYGYYCSNSWERDHNTWILWSGCLENEYRDYACEVSAPTYSLDIVPTLSNLFGLTYDSRLLVGRDVFSDEKPLVIWNNYNWRTDIGSYEAARKKFTPNPGCEYDQEYVDSINSMVHNKIRFSYQVIDNDYYGILFEEDEK